MIFVSLAKAVAVLVAGNRAIRSSPSHTTMQVSVSVHHLLLPPMTPTCDIAPKGSVLYVKITPDSTRTSGRIATVDAAPVLTCNGVNTTITILIQPTVNATGVATLDGSYATFLSVTVHYGSQSFTFDAYVQHSLTTCANLRLPSGSLSITSC
jgi:hypothetical protein